ncbi:phage holin family protein [Lichenibacterium ramalinae]|uniref:Phage holin family protein n=1 Tax=Lichenibacterium ramalinae TaxID=2316527 RepID=A0A4Q2RG82_9HYPH|nr:phage holin family protein [Lichenibacterium ramalinae]RYB06953.1 phage holin family protein [Lichenibacterium ramalinae]
MTVEPQGRPSTPSLFADALSQMTTLFETEIRLVRTEISEKLSLAIKAVIVLLVAAVLMLAGLFIILFGLVQLVIYLGVIYWLAYFVVGGAIAVIGAIALYVALNRLSTDNLMPKQSIDQLGKDAGVVKEQVK